MVAAWHERVLLVATCALVFAGCAHPLPLQAPEGVRLTPLKTISTLQARFFLLLAGLKGVSVSNAADCYRMLERPRSCRVCKVERVRRSAAGRPKAHETCQVRHQTDV